MKVYRVFQHAVDHSGQLIVAHDVATAEKIYLQRYPNAEIRRIDVLGDCLLEAYYKP